MPYSLRMRTGSWGHQRVLNSEQYSNSMRNFILIRRSLRPNFAEMRRTALCWQSGLHRQTHSSSTDSSVHEELILVIHTSQISTTTLEMADQQTPNNSSPSQNEEFDPSKIQEHVKKLSHKLPTGHQPYKVVVRARYTVLKVCPNSADSLSGLVAHHGLQMLFSTFCRVVKAGPL